LGIGFPVFRAKETIVTAQALRTLLDEGRGNKLKEEEREGKK
jgi:hypothetical protein